MWLNNFSINKSIKRNVISVCDLCCNLTQTSEANFKKGLSKLLPISCTWKGACDRKRPPERPSRAPFFLALITSKRSACYARLGWLDAPAVLPTHGLSFLYMTSWCLLITFAWRFFLMNATRLPYLETVKSFFSRSKIKSVLLEDADRKEKFKRILSFLFVEKGKSI